MLIKSIAIIVSVIIIITRLTKVYYAVPMVETAS